MAELPPKQTGKVILGTMRLLEVERSVDDWARFFKQVYDLGIIKLHSSDEYESFPLLCEILILLRTTAPEVKFQHIVKLAEPSFDDNKFSAGRLAEKVDNYRLKLGCDYVDDIQWMWRHGLDQDEARISRFEGAVVDIAQAVRELKSSGAIKRVLCFPYSTEFAKAAISQPEIDGLVVYRNVQETEYDEAIGLCNRLGKKAIVIRPLNAGKALTGEQRSPRQLFHYSMGMKSIEAGIISSSNIAHVIQFVD